MIIALSNPVPHLVSDLFYFLGLIFLIAIVVTYIKWFEITYFSCWA